MGSSYQVPSLYQQIINILIRFTSTKYWRVKLVIYCTCSSIFLSTPAYHYLPTAMMDENWIAFREKVNSPLSQPSFNDDTHAAKKTFRLTVPILAIITGLNNWGVFILQFCINLLFLFISILLIEKLTGDPIASVFTTIGLVCIYAGRSGFTDINTWFDIFAYCFLLLAIYYDKPVLIFLFIQLASWTDERAIVASSFVFIFWKLIENTNKRISFKSFFRLGWKSSTVIISLIVHFIIRLSLTYFVGLKTPLSNVGANTLINQTQFYGMGTWMGLEGFWLIVALSLLILYFNKQYFLLLIILIITSVSLVISFMVFDITRSSAYIFPLIFVSISLLINNLTIESMRKLLLISAAVCFLFPAYYIITDVYPYTLWYKPLFIRVIDLLKINQL